MSTADATPPTSTPDPSADADGSVPAITDADAKPRWRRGRQLSDGSRIYWWKEMLIVLVVDVIYESVRNLSSAKPQKAYDNAIRLIGWQKDLGIWHEHAIQQWALGFTPLIIAANYFYGSVYIAATVLGLIFLYRFPVSYTHLRAHET